MAAWELSIPLLRGNMLMSVPFCLDVPLIGLFVGFFVFVVVQVLTGIIKDVRFYSSTFQKTSHFLRH